MIILKNTGVRVSDLRQLGRQHIKDGKLVLKTFKTNVLCKLPINDELKNEIHGCDTMVFLCSLHGTPFASNKSMSQAFSKWCRQAGLTGISAHSVRKWLATRMANHKATENQLMAFFGWRDAKEARPYTSEVDRSRLADDAMDVLCNVEGFRCATSEKLYK